ncbi:MAG: hypothetical protein IIB31_08455 [Chloroflexi bacterium]|nr:hypothetical protein [Chloroflexota bacterium]
MIEPNDEPVVPPCEFLKLPATHHVVGELYPDTRVQLVQRSIYPVRG